MITINNSPEAIEWLETTGTFMFRPVCSNYMISTKADAICAVSDNYCFSCGQDPIVIEPGDR